MQFRRRAISAVLGAALAGNFQAGSALVLSATAAAQSGAVAWLRAHNDAPHQDELAELKNVNPEAYALVNALLTKRSLGLLDPRHPTASFSAAPPAASVPGADAFRQMAADSGDKPKFQAVYPDAPAASAHHDWMNWKPTQSATDDESMVQNMLGAVAAVKQNSQVEGPSAAPVEAPTIVAAAAPEAKPAASMNQENSYLKDIDFGLGAQPVRPRQNLQDNSYLKEFNNGEAATAAPARRLAQSSDSKNELASFSWNDEPPAPKAKPVQHSVAPQAAAAPKVDPKKDALLAWLSPAAANRVVVTTQSPAEQNSYLKDLNLN